MQQRPLTVALTGATGFVGRHVLPRLTAAGHRVRALVRQTAQMPASAEQITPVPGDLFDQNALTQLVQGADAVIHLVGIIMERPQKGQTFDRVHHQATVRLLDAAKTAGVKRWIHMSALGTRPDAVSNYHRTKWLAEEAVRRSGLDYTIFRPSIIHGPDGEFMQMVKQFCTRRFNPPFIPYFGGGLLGRKPAGKVQPVWVEDVARCFVEALTRPRTIGEVYPLGGPDAYTFPELYRTCQKHLKGAIPNKPIIPIPAWKAKMVAALELPGVPFNWDQVVMSQEQSTCSIAKMRHDFEFDPAPFEPTFADYADRV